MLFSHPPFLLLLFFFCFCFSPFLTLLSSVDCCLASSCGRRRTGQCLDASVLDTDVRGLFVCHILEHHAWKLGCNRILLFWMDCCDNAALVVGRSSIGR